MAAHIGSFRKLKHISVSVTALLANQRKRIHCVSRQNPVHKMTEEEASSTTVMGSLHSKFGWMSNKSRCFGVKGDDVQILTEPNQFYEALKTMTKGAKSRIVIASLYLGTGSLEAELVSSIEAACQEADRCGNDSFEVHILLDCNRGSRGGDTSSRTMLLHLLKRYKQYIHINLYHTPDLRGWLKKIVPERYDETIGLTHMKIYLADDSFIISGANLSDSYFTNRQDRYIVFNKCSELSNFFCDLVKTVSSFSFTLQSDNTTCLPADWPHHPYEDTDDGTAFKSKARERLLNLLTSENEYRQSSTDRHLNKQGERSHSPTSNTGPVDTWVCPLIQMGPFGIQVDEEVTKIVMKASEDGDRILLASGYFNLTDQYMDVILNQSRATYKILTASPQANGFYGGKGVAGHVPECYTHILKHFYSQVCALKEESRICIREYFRNNWTFHGKGLWYYLPGDTLPVMTFVGSPNFGYRSVYRDLECQVAIVTQNQSLKKRLREEHEQMYDLSTVVCEETFQPADRYVPFWVRLVTAMIKNFF